jgi:transglutaminase-like putative cysteine protease
MQVTVEHRSDTILSGKLPWLRLLPEDGWLTLALLVVVVYTTIASIQAVTPPWAPGLDILSLTTGMGLLLGYIVVQQGRLPGTLVHSVALILGIVFAFQQTANATLNGDRRALLRHMQDWFQRSVLNHETSSDNTVFLLFLAVLSFLLAYISIWLVLHSRRPWLAALANGVVLLINLNWATQDKAVFFIILFLLATLLLLVRFTLAENVRQWRARGLRFSPDLGWDFMQAGAIFAVVVLTLANILPAGAGNTSILSAWNSPKNPWQSVQTTFQTLFNGVQGGRGGGNGSGFTFFGSELALGSDPNLPSVPILHYTLASTGNDPGQYLITQTFDQYDETTGVWSSSNSVPVLSSPGEPVPGSVNPAYFKINAYDITLDQSLADNPLFAPGSLAQSFSVASQTYISQTSNMPVKWTSENEQRAGTKYSATAYVSTATQHDLQLVKMPSEITDPNQRAQQYPSDILQEYLPPTSGSLPSIVIQDAKSWTSGALNMYDAATDIQDLLHAKFRYSLHISPPAGEDPLVWFLTNKTGFCTYFATAMVMMARYLGIPSRIAMGFASGQYDSKTGNWSVLGTQAHAWPQIYFGSQYGWINFEPTFSFNTFTRGAGSGAGGGSATQSPGASSTPNRTLPNLNKNRPQSGSPGGNNTPGHVNSLIVDAGLGFTLAILLSLLGLVLLATWWRLLYRGLSPIVASFARIARLGAWAGVVPKRSQTPDEYVEQLGRLIPGQRPALERLSHLYARERWGGGLPEEITGVEVPRLYTEVRQSISHRIADRLRTVPVKTFTALRRLLIGKDGYNGSRRSP